MAAVTSIGAATTATRVPMSTAPWFSLFATTSEYLSFPKLTLMYFVLQRKIVDGMGIGYSERRVFSECQGPLVDD
jgi:hypothetical protein